ncbi:putative hydrolase of the HAD superfamily [Sinobacterium caligoides]|uniref:phosphoglycolate phosphatase n=1 Tax=Sinobacterium caligoides TaxID=933926 RepID=A0A3N2DNM6_9GAMM|nr:HAD family hydrolase [Sinobacterium caligoides]ROS01292.1 putative hydrolase of the HAD superfamily [Sinobacterium caligoides]
MFEVYLFDWGDTLMVDSKDTAGKMCDWSEVQAMPGAYEVLEKLSQQAKIYIATGASSSSADDIEKAFQRVNMSQFIDGYFCQDNLGIAKGLPDFLPAIIARLGRPQAAIAMVGDSWQKDMQPALLAGIQPIWLSQQAEVASYPAIRIIRCLNELCCP